MPEELGGDANGSLSDGAKTPEVVDAADGGEDVDALDPLDDPCSDLPDQPVDYLLRTTEIGRAALDEFEPAKRFSELLAAEPDGYGDAYDRVLATEFGTYAAKLIEADHYGVAVAMRNNIVTSNPLKDIAGKTKLVPETCDMLTVARRMGISLG